MKARDRFPGLDTQVAVLLERAAEAGLAPLVSLTPRQARARVAAGNLTRDQIKVLATTEDRSAGPDGPAVRVYRPSNAMVDLAIVYLHGGGWVTGDLDYSDEVCRLFAARARVPVVSVDYRLAPEWPFPAAVDDAIAAVRWTLSGAIGDIERVVVAGDSAGGGLAAVCAQQCDAVVGQVLLYPALDCDTSTDSYRRNSGILIGVAEMDWFFQQYVPETADRVDPRFAPGLAADLSGLPPALVVVAGHDPLRDGGVEYAELLMAAGVKVTLREYPALPHGFLRLTTVVDAAADAGEAIAGLVADLVSSVLPP